MLIRILSIALLVATCARAQDAAGPTTTATSSLRIVCFGDSITGDRPRKAYLHQYLKYCDILGTIVEAAHPGTRVTILNRGWGGDATFAKPSQSMPGAVGRLKEDVIDEKPDIAIVLIGGNDASSKQVTCQQTKENLRTIARSLREAGIRTLFLQYHVIVNPANPDKAWTHLASNNAAIAEIAGEFGFPVLAMQPAIDAALAHQPLEELVNPLDGVHLAPGGELVYARTLYAKLNELRWLDPAQPSKEK